MNSLATLLAKSVSEKGWLSISNVYFDNSIICNVANTLGYVAMSESEGLMFWTSCLDITDSTNLEANMIFMDPHFVCHQQTLSTQDMDCLQHFDYALYSHYGFYWDEQQEMPLPKIPTPSELEAMVKDETTGLYPNTDTLVNMKRRYAKDSNDSAELSVINMYTDDQFVDKHVGATSNYLTHNTPLWDIRDYPNGVASTVFASAVNIDRWKAFYTNQKKFAAAVAKLTGIGDVK